MVVALIMDFELNSYVPQYLSKSLVLRNRNAYNYTYGEFTMNEQLCYVL